MKHLTRHLVIRLLFLSAVLTFLHPFHTEAHAGTFVFTEVRPEGQVIHVNLRFDTVTALEIPGSLDANGDKHLDEQELKQALAPVLLPMIEQGLKVENNGKLLHVKKAEGSMPNPSIVRLQLDYAADEPVDKMKLTYGLFFEKAPGHNNIGTFQLPDGGTKEFVLNAADMEWSYSLTSGGAGTWGMLKQFVRLGILHIWSGYDHLLFLLALLLAVSSWRSVLLMVSSFTISHSVTLILAATGVVTLPSRMVEVCIALTIVYVAVENLFFARTIRYRAILTFGFGFIHGFGFASALKEIGLPKHQEIQSLLTFNVGVELGQLAVVACLIPLLAILRNRSWYGISQKYASTAIGLMGLYWLMIRL